MDRLFQNVIENALQFRYDKIVAGEPIWPWALGVFLIGFLVLLVFVLIIVLYTTLLERKFLGWVQIRMGPNRVGPWGLLQPIADMIKLLVKEDIVPCAADRWLHLIAPLIIFVPTMLAFVVIPFGKGTVELPQQLVSPTFKYMWVKWINPDEAATLGYPGPGWLEAPVAVETDETTHKTWWVDKEIDHEPLYLPVDDSGLPLDKRYRFTQKRFLRLPVKPKAQAQVGKTEYAEYAMLIDYNSILRKYDVIEVKWPGKGHQRIIELGLDSLLIDRVEKTYGQIIDSIGADTPEKEFDFGDKSKERFLNELNTDFSESIAINNRKFGADCMVPAFGTVEGKKLGWRDLYTPDFKSVAFIHGMISRKEKKGSLVFFPAQNGAKTQNHANLIEDYDLDTVDWIKAGGAFRIQRITGGGYFVEDRSGTKTTLSNPGDSVTVPLGDTTVSLTLKDRQYYNIYLMGKNLNAGILYLFAVTSITVLGIFMAGFGSNNKWSLYGAMRSAAQLMSYEIPMTLAIIGPILMSGSLSTVEIVESQRALWFFIPQFLAWFIFVVCMTAEVNRNPFDLPEAESELVAGFHTEYTGLKFGFFFLAEYANMFVASAIMTVLFFGGWQGPIIPFLGEFISSFIWFMLKTFVWLCIFIWFRATFPRFRIDQLMDYAWKILVPVALLNVITTGYFTYSDWFLQILKENNWRWYQGNILPLFTNEYTVYYAVPAILIITILVIHESIGAYRDAQKLKRPNAELADFKKRKKEIDA